MAKGENVGKPGSPGWQRTDRTKDAGKTPPVSDVPVTNTSAFPAMQDPGVQWLANGLGMTEWLNSLSDQVIWDSYAGNIEASAVWDSYKENLTATAMREGVGCPNGCDLRGEPIPQKYLDKGYYAEGATHYSRMIGVEVSGLYDGVAYWTCPDCGINWHRFGPGDRRHDAVERLWEKEAPDGFTVGAQIEY